MCTPSCSTSRFNFKVLSHWHLPEDLGGHRRRLYRFKRYASASSTSLETYKARNGSLTGRAGQDTALIIEEANSFVLALRKTWYAVLVAVGILLFPFDAHSEVSSSSDKESLTIKFRASKDTAIRTAQEALVESWGYATTQFLDPSFNNVNWPQQLQAYSGASQMTISSLEAYPRVLRSLDKRQPMSNSFPVHP